MPIVILCERSLCQNYLVYTTIRNIPEQLMALFYSINI